MSKAFTREDDLPDPGARKRLPSPLPPGTQNYITPEGAKRLKAELDRLMDEDRRQASKAPSDQGSSERSHDALAERIDHLRRSLESAVVVSPATGEVDSVRFGASVSVRTAPDGEVTRYRIVGVDETDVAQGWISWVSPIARALISARVGDRVQVRLPSGEKELEIVGIAND